MQRQSDGEYERAAEAALAGGLWQYAVTVLYPAAGLKRLGLYHPARAGVLPPLPRAAGLGARFSREHPFPVLEEPDAAEEPPPLTPEQWAGARPIFEETLAVLRPYLTPAARILDTSAGPHAEALELAPLVPEGEVVVADPAAATARAAFERAREQGIANLASFQADPTALPPSFEAAFDLAFCALGFHRASDREAEARALADALRPGGYAFVVDLGLEWLARPSDGAWPSLQDGGERRGLFERAGFAHVCVEELLPGVLLAVAMRRQ